MLNYSPKFSHYWANSPNSSNHLSFCFPTILCLFSKPLMYAISRMSSPINALVKSNPYVRLIIGVLRLYIIIYTCTYTSTYLRTQCKSTACTSSFILKKIQFATVWYCVLELIHSNELEINYIFIEKKKKILNHNRSHKKISVNYSEGEKIFFWKISF